MITKEEVAETIFKVKPKFLKEFTFISPKKNKITGYINLSFKPNAGSLYITYLNDKEHGQFVPGMKKLKYWSKHYNPKNIFITIKEDGTNLCFWPLLSKDNQVIEVLIKTRREPIIRRKWIHNNVISQKHFDRVQNTKQVFCYELFGQKNKYEINYDSDLQIKLISIYNLNGDLVPFNEYDIYDDVIEESFKINNNELFYTKYFRDRFEKYLPANYIYKHNSLEECYTEISNICEQINDKAKKLDNKTLIEGSIWNFWDENDCTQKQIKNKSFTFEENHRTINGINKIFIKKELQKWTESKSKIEAENIFNKNKQEIIDYINEELKTEWLEHNVMKNATQNRIHRIVDAYFGVVPITNEELIEIVPKLEGETIPEKLANFALKYPHLKKKANIIFQLLKEEK